MINIVVPMAGRGQRFINAGYTTPKPLIKIKSETMISLVINNIKPAEPHRFIFLCLQDHIDQYQIDQKLKEIEPACVVVPVNQVTEGAACTVLLARDYIDNKDALMIANSDQWVDLDINDYLAQLEKDHSDGLIMTMKASDPKWSFVRIDEKGNIVEVVEKKVVSDEATVGIYNFKKGSQFVQAAEEMIQKNLRVNNEFYVAPVYNLMIEKGHKITIFNIGKVMDGMYGLGVPADLDAFLTNPVCDKALQFATSH